MLQIIKAGADAALSETDVQQAVMAARACKVVAFPTETGYMLGSTGLVKAATRKILQMKGRTMLKPLVVFVPSIEEAKRWVEWTPDAQVLAKRFWPGPLTLVLKPTDEGRILTFSEYPTVALRLPAHPVARALLAASSFPWICSSANASGSPTLRAAAAVSLQFAASAHIMIDGGLTPGDDATFIDASQVPARVLKQGLPDSTVALAALTEMI